jgi:Pvc16 N-terminal domain/Concanavalin A-like lectin/glucanases superfamily
MSDFRGPAHVTASLRMMLEDLVNNETGMGCAVTTKRPDQVGAVAVPTINIYLYQVVPNTHWRGHDLPMRNDRGDLVQQPRAAVDLYYLISFYGDEEQLAGQRLMASTVRVMHQFPVLDRSYMTAALAHYPLAGSDLPSEPERVRFTPSALNLEEMSKLWSVFFQTQYSLSVAYCASVVFIQDKDPLVVAKQVLERKVDVETISSATATPLDIPALGMWLRSDKGLSEKADGSIEWLDQSGKQRHASQVSTAITPTPKVLAHAIGARAALNFDGANDQLALNHSFTGTVRGVTVCVVMRTTGTGDQAVISFDRDEFWELGTQGMPVQAVWRTHTSALSAAPPALEEGWHILYATFDTASADQKRCFIDGTEVAHASPAPGTPLIGAGTRFGFLGASSKATTFNGALNGAFFKGDIAEVILYERALEERERNTLFRYLRDQYGIP